jgi:hypothetical protein
VQHARAASCSRGGHHQGVLFCVALNAMWPAASALCAIHTACLLGYVQAGHASWVLACVARVSVHTWLHVPRVSTNIMLCHCRQGERGGGPLWSIGSKVTKRFGFCAW